MRLLNFRPSQSHHTNNMFSPSKISLFFQTLALFCALNVPSTAKAYLSPMLRVYLSDGSFLLGRIVDKNKTHTTIETAKGARITLMNSFLRYRRIPKPSPTSGFLRTKGFKTPQPDPSHYRLSNRRGDLPRQTEFIIGSSLLGIAYGVPLIIIIYGLQTSTKPIPGELLIHLLPVAGPFISAAALIYAKQSAWAPLAGLSLTIGIAQAVGIALFAYAIKKPRPLIPFWTRRLYPRNKLFPILNQPPARAASPDTRPPRTLPRSPTTKVSQLFPIETLR